MTALLTVEDLWVNFGTSTVVKGVNFSLNRGEMLALVGESGSGKSVTALSILGLLPDSASHPKGRITLEEQPLLNQPQAVMQALRGNRISMIFQEPMTSLNPLHTVEKQLAEVLYLHAGLNRRQARSRILALLEQVGISEPHKRLGAYPHELSGGQRQRVMIAMALANEPELLIADEPTTALDVTIARQILTLLGDLQRELNMAVLLISHDLNVVRRHADRVVVMQQGQVVEQGETESLFSGPQHPYTRTLLDAEPSGQPAALPAESESPLLSAELVRVWFPIKKGVLQRTVDHVKAVDGVSLSLRPGETLGVVGESGSGKSTLAQALLKLNQFEGQVSFAGQPIEQLSQAEFRPLRQQMQIVFQDPYGSLSPRMSVLEIVSEGLKLHEALSPAQLHQRVAQVLEEVGMAADSMNRYPHEFSGGQRQRIAIARALVLRPRLLVLDEPTSALDRTVQKQLIELLRAVQRRHRLSYLFISHDLAVVRALSHRVLVMRHGKPVEYGAAKSVFEQPKSEYTRQLVAAALL